MRAAKWKLEDGKKRLKGTLEWRRQFKPDLISPEEVRHSATIVLKLCLTDVAQVKIEAETGKMFVISPFIPFTLLILLVFFRILNGFDLDGRPIITMRPGRENTETSPRQLRHLVYVL